MTAEDQIEDMVDKEMYAEMRDALTTVMDALQPLSREDRIKIMQCAKQFFGLPRPD